MRDYDKVRLRYRLRYRYYCALGFIKDLLCGKFRQRLVNKRRARKNG